MLSGTADRGLEKTDLFVAHMVGAFQMDKGMSEVDEGGVIADGSCCYYLFAHYSDVSHLDCC